MSDNDSIDLGNGVLAEVRKHINKRWWFRLFEFDLAKMSAMTGKERYIPHQLRLLNGYCGSPIKHGVGYLLMRIHPQETRICVIPLRKRRRNINRVAELLVYNAYRELRDGASSGVRQHKITATKLKVVMANIDSWEMLVSMTARHARYVGLRLSETYPLGHSSNPVLVFHRN